MPAYHYSCVLNQPVLLYDGDCGFCRQWVERLQGWDRDGAIRCVPARERASVAGLPPIDDDALDRAMHLVTTDGTVYPGARAVPVVLQYLSHWRWLRILFLIPGAPWVADRVYSNIAKRRHRFGCGSARCRIGGE